MNSGQRTSRRAMTLLEVVLAVTLLASMSAVLASLWAQASAWTDDSTSHHRAMRLARVTEMVRSQWADRRTSAALDSAGASAVVEPGALTFVTATAVLEPGWALVRARYVVERDYETGVGVQAAWRLVYEELPLVDLAAPAGVPGERLGTADNRARNLVESPREKRILLLAGCGELRWERFGRSLDVEDEGSVAASGEEGTPAEAVRARSRTEDEVGLRWREIEAEFVGHARAVRLVGEFEERRFTCVFVIGDSR